MARPAEHPAASKHYAAADPSTAQDLGPLTLHREGDTIFIYPGPYRLTVSEWASAVAFTTTEGETGPMYRALLALIGETDA